MVTTVTGKNQVTVPAEIVRQFEIKPGCQMDWIPGKDWETIVVHVRADRATQARRLMGAGAKYLKKGADPVAELAARRVREEAERNRAL